jgi:signal peptidase I
MALKTDSSGKKKAHKKKTLFREYAESLISAFILALIVLTFIGRAFKIPSSSMVPTLRIGDRIFVNRFIYKIREPERGDLAVFVYPEDETRDFIKRIVGLPGEILEIKDGRIYIDGEPAAENALSEFNYYRIGPFGSGEIEIPGGGYYVLGDNSGNSKDSRYWGFVPEEYLKGKAFFIYWPPGRMRKL